MTEKPYEFITESQRQFVVDRRVTLDNRGWATDYQENLFAPLHPGSVADFEREDRLFPADPMVFDTNPLSLGHGACGVAYVMHKLRGQVDERVLDWI